LHHLSLGSAEEKAAAAAAGEEEEEEEEDEEEEEEEERRHMPLLTPEPTPAPPFLSALLLPMR